MGVLDDISKNTDKEIAKIKAKTDQVIADKNQPQSQQKPTYFGRS